jgi:hypothetical protein
MKGPPEANLALAEKKNLSLKNSLFIRNKCLFQSGIMSEGSKKGNLSERLSRAGRTDWEQFEKRLVGWMIE